MGQNLTRENVVSSFPESVRAWLTDGKVASAVNSITRIKNDELAVGLKWDEFEPFLQARAMAHLTRAEYPIAAWRFWEAVWGDWQPSGFKRETIDGNGKGLLGPKTTWDDSSIAVEFHSEEITLYSLVGIEPESTIIAFYLEHDDGEAIIATSNDAFKWYGPKTKWDGYMVAAWEHSVTSSDFDWDALIVARNHAIELVDRELIARAKS